MQNDKRTFILDNAAETMVIANVKQFTPILNRSQIVGDGEAITPSSNVDDIVYNMSFKNKLIDTANLEDKVAVKITDPDDTNDEKRFYLITEVCSILTKQSALLYYDTKYNDMIFVPFLDKEIEFKTTISIYGVRGINCGGLSTNSVNSTNELPPLKGDGPYIRNSKTHTFSDMFQMESKFKSLTMELDDYGTESTRENIHEYFSLGSSADLFDGKVPHKVLRTYPFGTSDLLTNKSDIDDVLIHLPF